MTEILRDKLQDGCYAVQWLKMRCGNRGEKSNLILLRAILLATTMWHDFKIARHQGLSGIICTGVLRLPHSWAFIPSKVAVSYEAQLSAFTCGANRLVRRIPFGAKTLLVTQNAFLDYRHTYCRSVVQTNNESHFLMIISIIICLT